MSGSCYYCGTTEDTRPYGPGGSSICYPCATESPERDGAAKAVFLAQLDAASAISPVVIIDEEGPNPA